MFKSLLVSSGMCVVSVAFIAILAKCCDAYCCQLVLVKAGILAIYILVGYLGGRFVKGFNVKPYILPLLLFLVMIYAIGFIVDGHEGDTLIKTCVTYVIIATSYALAFVK